MRNITLYSPYYKKKKIISLKNNKKLIVFYKKLLFSFLSIFFPLFYWEHYQFIAFLKALQLLTKIYYISIKIYK